MIELYVAVVVLLICLFFKWHLSYWARRKIDGPAPLPIFGNLFEYVIGKKHFAELEGEIYRSYPTANYVGIYNMNTPALLARDLDFVKNVLVKDFDSFADNQFTLDEKTDPLFAENPFITVGEKWKMARARVSPILTMAKIKQLLPLIEDVAGKMTEYIGCDPESNDPNGIEAKELCSKFTTDVVAICAFGMNGESFTNPNSPFYQITGTLFTSGVLSLIGTALSMFMPTMAKLMRIPFVTPESDAKLRMVMKQIMEHRQTSNEARPDFLDSMLKLREKVGEAEFSDEQIVAYSLMFLLEGFETSSSLMAFCLYEMAMNPHIQKQAQEEIDAALARNGQKLTMECLQEMTLMDQILNETLRMHPPALDLKKLVTKPYKLPPQYVNVAANCDAVVDKGAVVIIPIYAIQMDPKHYPEPTKFDPSRFAEDKMKTSNKYAFLAFGEGPRICLGIKFGLTQSKLGLAKLLSQYDVTFSPKMTLPMVMSKKIFLLSSEHGIWVKLTKRAK